MSVRRDLGTLPHSCNNCGKCCKRRSDLTLTPMDVLHISQYLKMSAEEFIHIYCDVVDSFDVCVKSIGSSKSCIFLTTSLTGFHSCHIYDVRPMECYLYPLRFRPENKNKFFVDTNAQCSFNGTNQTFLDYADKISNHRYACDFDHYRKFCMAIGAYYSEKTRPCEAEMFEFFFYNKSEEELNRKLNNYLFGKKHEDTA